MSSRTRRSELDLPSRHGIGPSLRRWTIPAIGAVTPVGLIVVNIAAFIVRNLPQFRLGISVLAFVSGLMLNAWAGLKIYRVAKLRFPRFSLLHDRNQEVVLVVGMALIAGISFVEALFCYNGLSNEANLPNAPTFILGIVAIAIPILLQAVFGKLLLERNDQRRDERVDGYPLPPPPAPGDTWRP
ncbi:MAG TPA: hypothetical protein VH661_03910 [Candidatus Dormibacteraeota bacterium]|jgi:hypothetical protein|nr:hypothetical protein [Candidatus Dormibacteraeota bacterium]